MKRLSLALVASLAAATTLAAGPGDAAAFRLAKETSHQKTAGKFGGGYYAGAYVEGNRTRQGLDLDAYAGANVNARLFGNRVDLASIGIYARNDNSGAAAGAGIYAAGIKLWGVESSSAVEHEIEVPIYGASFRRDFKALGVKVKVRASVGGVAGVTAGAGVSQSGLEVYGGPYVSAGISASAKAGTKGLKIKLSGGVTLARIDAQGLGELEWDPRGRVTARASFGFNLNFLAGEIKLKLKLFRKKLGDWELFDYRGINRYIRLGSAQTSWNL